MNKKGFTLIEMLVVIAIIAVLVAIVIPTVTSATDKAAAATNAANLRAVYAELQTDKLSSGADTKGYVVVTESSGTLTYSLATSTANGGIVPPTAAKVGSDIVKGTAMSLDATTGEPVYNGKTINDFATYAETGAWPTT